MAADGGPAPWSRFRDAWWVVVLAVIGLSLFSAGFVERLHCGWGRCRGSTAALLFDLDSLGGLPRFFTTGLFVAVAVLAWRARQRTAGTVARWWGMTAVIGAGLAVAKLSSLHGFLKTDGSPGLTLVLGLGLTVVTLRVLWATGHRWGVPATGAVVLALGLYAAAALGLDVVTGVAEMATGGGGRFTDAAATFVEEFGEALTALVVLGVVHWRVPDASDGGR